MTLQVTPPQIPDAMATRPPAPAPPGCRPGASAVAARPARPEAGVPRPPAVLFVCERNAGRSQMGAALLDQHSHGRVQARSAGPAPAATVAAPVVEAMAEIGIDLSEASPTRLTDEAVRTASVVISMGCGEALPIYPHTRYLHWELEDPAEMRVEEVRPIRDEIDARVRALLYSLGVAARVGLLRDQPDRGTGPGQSGYPQTGHMQAGHAPSGPRRLLTPPPRARVSPVRPARSAI
ncbi:Protein-tyrosine-phosphatase (fragment) [Frankia canadensis]|uniref:Protein-tyrosine-phosphatase n=1 Tax=Frankia canadensis TaxID=1836972 RepID=A0A2I2KT17_9ACTN